MNNLKSTFILSVIILLGYLLRSYNLDFPSIGYHNMKENEYLSMAQEMKRTGDLVTKRVYFYNAFENNPTERFYPQLPLVSYQILLSWRMLGDNLWGPRLFNVLFGLGSILVIYFISLLLFRDITVSLFCALLLAIMPLAVFFSRNLQPESPAFFFMLIANLFYLKFITSLGKRNLVWGGLLFSLAWLYKFSFFIGILPAMFCFPYRRIYKEKKELSKYVAALLLPYALIVVSIIWLKYTNQWVFDYRETWGRVNIFSIFSLTYLKTYGHMIWWYIQGENFTPIYTVLAILGMVIAFIKRKTLLDRSIIGWFLSIVLYCMIFSDHINQHNYYQMPFLALISIASAYALLELSKMLSRFLTVDVFVFVAIFVVSLSGFAIYQSIARMQGTVFLGEDVAGESLKEFTAPDERIFILTHTQGWAIARYAQRYTGWPANFDEFKENEKKLNVRYICLYPAGFLWMLEKNEPALFAYIQENYHIKEVGLIEEPNELNYLILERGKGADIKKSLQSLSGQLERRTVYKVLGRYIFFSSMRPHTQ